MGKYRELSATDRKLRREKGRRTREWETAEQEQDTVEETEEERKHNLERG